MQINLKYNMITCWREQVISLVHYIIISSISIFGWFEILDMTITLFKWFMINILSLVIIHDNNVNQRKNGDLQLTDYLQSSCFILWTLHACSWHMPWHWSVQCIMGNRRWHHNWNHFKLPQRNNGKQSVQTLFIVPTTGIWTCRSHQMGVWPNAAEELHPWHQNR